MSQSLRARNTLRLAHAAPPVRYHRPIPRRLAIIVFGCVLVPILVLVAELVQGLVRGWLA